MGISAGRFGWSAFVIFEEPTPRMSANASKSFFSVGHGTVSCGAASEACEAIPRKASLDCRGAASRIAAISAAEIRAPPRFASLRSDSSNDLVAKGRRRRNANPSRGSRARLARDPRCERRSEGRPAGSNPSSLVHRPRSHSAALSAIATASSGVSFPCCARAPFSTAGSGSSAATTATGRAGTARSPVRPVIRLREKRR